MIATLRALAQWYSIHFWPAKITIGHSVGWESWESGGLTRPAPLHRMVEISVMIEKSHSFAWPNGARIGEWTNLERSYPR